MIPFGYLFITVTAYTLPCMALQFSFQTCAHTHTNQPTNQKRE